MFFICSITAAEVAEDSSLLAVGFSDSLIKVWSLVPQKLRTMKSADQLDDVEKDAGKFFFAVISFSQTSIQSIYLLYRILKLNLPIFR